MKKSKIIGLCLGFTALTAVAITTPFLVTSCSSTTADNDAITANIKKEFITMVTPAPSGNDKLPDNAIVTGENAATIYTGNHETISFTLQTDIKKIMSVRGTDLEYVNVTSVTWRDVENSDFTLKSNTFTLIKKLTNDNNTTKYFETTLVADIEGTEIPEDNDTNTGNSGTTNGSATTYAEADATEPKKVKKTLSIKLFIALGNNPKTQSN
ncbi:MAG: hypothetical protein K2K73_03175 [Ureaplasma sp.]|nr:hypothetical protein [Ureaplasma sp.]